MKRTALYLGSAIKLEILEAVHRNVTYIHSNNFNMGQWIEKSNLKDRKLIFNNKRALLSIQVFATYRFWPLFPEDMWDVKKSIENDINEEYLNTLGESYNLDSNHIYKILNKLKDNTNIKNTKKVFNFYSSTIEQIYADYADIIFNFVESYSSVVELSTLSISDNYDKTVLITSTRMQNEKYPLDGYTLLFLDGLSGISSYDNVANVFYPNSIPKVEPKFKKLIYKTDKYTQLWPGEIDNLINKKMRSIFKGTLKSTRTLRIKDDSMAYINKVGLKSYDELREMISLINKPTFTIEEDKDLNSKHFKSLYKNNRTNDTDKNKVSSTLLLINMIYKIYNIEKKFDIQAKDDGFYVKNGRVIYPQPSCGTRESNSILRTLTRIHDDSKSSFAYKKKKSSVHACIEHIGSEHFIKIDISKYFDSIIKNVLKGKIVELFGNAMWERINDTGIFIGKKGIKQGYILSPILSDIYLTEFDKWCSKMSGLTYTRYSDDILFSSPDKFDDQKLLEDIKNKFTHLGLKINKEKIKRSTGTCNYLGLTINKKEVKFSRRKTKYFENLIESFSDKDLITDKIRGEISYYNYVNKEASIKPFESDYKIKSVETKLLKIKHKLIDLYDKQKEFKDYKFSIDRRIVIGDLKITIRYFRGQESVSGAQKDKPTPDKIRVAVLLEVNGYEGIKLDYHIYPYLNKGTLEFSRKWLNDLVVKRNKYDKLLKLIIGVKEIKEECYKEFMLNKKTP